MVSERLQKATDAGIAAARELDEATKALAQATRDLRACDSEGLLAYAQAKKDARHRRDAAITAAIVAAKSAYKREIANITRDYEQPWRYRQARSEAQSRYYSAVRAHKIAAIDYILAKKEEPPEPVAELSTDTPAE